MADKYDRQKRSDIMSKISGKENSLEIRVRKYLFKKGFRYRKNVASMAGKPDIVLRKYKTIIFINGCYWHGHSCPAAKLPETQSEFWSKKINDTKARDANNIKYLEGLGWGVIVLWQCELRNNMLFDSRMAEVISQVQSK